MWTHFRKSGRTIQGFHLSSLKSSARKGKFSARNENYIPRETLNLQRDTFSNVYLPFHLFFKKLAILPQLFSNIPSIFHIFFTVIPFPLPSFLGAGITGFRDFSLPAFETSVILD